MENMNNFYIFLDIDGVLWDWKWRLDQIKLGNIKKGISISNFNAESVNALNFLISEISAKYNCILVISSTWRNFMDETIQVLSENGVVLPETIDRTKVPISFDRGTEILDYLNQKLCNKNYVIIDDEVKNIRKIFPASKIIKTSINNASLKLSQTKEWLQNNLEINTAKTAEIENY